MSNGSGSRPDIGFFTDCFYTCVFWLFVAIAGLPGLWEFVEWVWRGPAEYPSRRGEESREDGEEWERLSDEDRKWLRHFFK